MRGTEFRVHIYDFGSNTGWLNTQGWILYLIISRFLKRQFYHTFFAMLYIVSVMALQKNEAFSPSLTQQREHHQCLNRFQMSFVCYFYSFLSLSLVVGFHDGSIRPIKLGRMDIVIREKINRLHGGAEQYVRMYLREMKLSKSRVSGLQNF